MSNHTSPVQDIVLDYIGTKAVIMTDMCNALETTTRYVRSTIERAALELVEQGVLAQEGNLLMLADASNETAECVHTAPACARCI